MAGSSSGRSMISLSASLVGYQSLLRSRGSNTHLPTELQRAGKEFGAPADDDLVDIEGVTTGSDGEIGVGAGFEEAGSELV